MGGFVLVEEVCVCEGGGWRRGRGGVGLRAMVSGSVMVVCPCALGLNALARHRLHIFLPHLIF